MLLLSTVLWLGTAIALQAWGGPTGDVVIDGGLAVAVGLYACSHPAVNLARMLLFEMLPSSSRSTGRGPVWLLLNLTSAVAGWFERMAPQLDAPAKGLFGMLEEYMNDHPSSASRVKAIRDQIAAEKLGGGKNDRNEEAYLQATAKYRTAEQKAQR